MIVGIGVDVCSVQRMKDALGRHPGMAEKIFLPSERLTKDGKLRDLESLAGRFAAKEALIKALDEEHEGNWSSIEVVREAGAPSLVLSGAVCERAGALGVSRTHLSITHDGGIAAAFVVLEKDE